MLFFNYSSRGSVNGSFETVTVLVEVPCQLGRLLFEEIQSKPIEMERHLCISKTVGLYILSQDGIPRLCFTIGTSFVGQIPSCWAFKL